MAHPYFRYDSSQTPLYNYFDGARCELGDLYASFREDLAQAGASRHAQIKELTGKSLFPDEFIERARTCDGTGIWETESVFLVYYLKTGDVEKAGDLLSKQIQSWEGRVATRTKNNGDGPTLASYTGSLEAIKAIRDEFITITSRAEFQGQRRMLHAAERCGAAVSAA